LAAATSRVPLIVGSADTHSGVGKPFSERRRPSPKRSASQHGVYKSLLPTYECLP
jgi:hypothetical protein